MKENVNNFFIHALNDTSIKLELPIPPHKKTVNDFFIVTDGLAKRQVGIRSYEIHKNELLIVPRLHVSTTDNYSDDINGFYCHFSDDFLGDRALLTEWNFNTTTTNKIRVDCSVFKRVVTLLTIMNNLYKEGFHKNKNLLEHYLRTVIVEINLKDKKKIHSNINKKQEITTAYIKLINTNLNKRYSIKQIADILNLSPNHLNKTIKSHVGKSAQEVYTEIIIQEAKVLLLQTSKDIGEIAFDLGFNDLSYFSKFFKKSTDLTPIAYRKMIEKYH